MIKFNFLNKLNFPGKRFKIFILSLFVLLVLIPFFVFATGRVLDGYQSLKNNGLDTQPVYWNTKNDPNDIASSTGACIINNSSNDYFIPTRTLDEWTAYTSKMTALNMVLSTGPGLPGGICNNGSCQTPEACDINPGECGT